MLILRHMVEDLSRFRSSEPTSNVNVKLYRFLEHDIDIPDDPEKGNWAGKMLRYAELHEETLKAKQNHTTPSPELVEEKRQLSTELDGYLSRRFKRYRRSVLKSSLGQNTRPHAHGKDSHVYYYGEMEDFIKNPDTPRYVQKYSVPSRETGPDNIEYLAKKYKLLRKFLGEHIPRAWFILGEYRHGIPKQGLGNLHTTLRAITIQREVRGKTFSEMTQEMRERPEVQEALKEAITKYRELRAKVERVCKEINVDFKKFQIELDIGSASPSDPSQVFDALTYQSPNVMYDERKKKVFFIDMGWGTWNPDKQKVFDYLMMNPDA